MSLESFYNEYDPQDFAIIFANFQDEDENEDEASLLSLTCRDVDSYGFTFRYYIIDTNYTSNPSSSFSRKYRANTIPSNLVLDDDMVVRYKLGEYSPSGLRSMVNQLMQE